MVEARPIAQSREDRYAELIVRVGANVQPGQLVDLTAAPEQAALARALVRASYQAGASYVDLRYFDTHLRRALIESTAGDDELSWTPPWLMTREREFGDRAGAVIAIRSEPFPTLLADLPGERVGKARMVELAAEVARQTNEQLTNWVVVGAPGPGWAEQMFGEPDVEQLWQLVEHCVRLDEDDPVTAWIDHVALLRARAQSLDELHIDSLHFQGPGTDLHVGLLPESRWIGGGSTTLGGIPYVANLPTEEVYTTPDARRTVGTVTATMPLSLNGVIVEGLRMRFAEGRIVEVDAEQGADVVRGELATDQRASFLGEVALVDGTSRVGQSGVTFFDSLYDENATCHIAYGGAYAEAAPGGAADGVNDSSVHTDFMIGGPNVSVHAVTRSGAVVPLLRDDVWQPGE